MKLTDAFKNSVDQIKNFKISPKVVKNVAMVGGGLMFLLNAVDSANDRKTMKAELMDEMGDEMVAKVVAKLSESNKGS